MGKRSIVVSLLTDQQEFQLLQAKDAAEAAKRHGLGAQILFADNNAVQQIHQLFQHIHAPEEERPAAIIVETVTGEGLERVARNAARAGIGWIVLNQQVTYVDDLRSAHPALAIGAVGCNHREAGRIQGRQVRALCPNLQFVLYVQGPADTAPAIERLAGTRAILGAGAQLKVVTGQWTEESGEKAVAGFLRLGTEAVAPDLVVAQNDSMAMGARRALERQRPEWGKVRYLGCDGTPQGGQRLVDEGRLHATVVISSNTGPAIEVMSRWLSTGQRPAAETLLSPRSYPTEERLGTLPPAPFHRSS